MLLLELLMLLLVLQMWLRLSQGEVSAVEEALSSMNRSLLRRTPKLNTSSWWCGLPVSNCLYRALMMLCWLKLVWPMSMLSSSLILVLLVETAEGQELVIDRSAALSIRTDEEVSCIFEFLMVELELVDEASELLDLCCSCCCTASKLFWVILSSAKNRQSNFLSWSSSSTAQCEVRLSLLELVRDTKLVVFDVLRIRLEVDEEDEDDEVLLTDGGKFFCVKEVNETVLASLDVPAATLTFGRISVAGTSREYESLKSSSRTTCNF